MKRVVPPFLSRGDPVSLVAPAGPDDPRDGREGAGRVGAIFEIVHEPDRTGVEGFLAAPDEARLEELRGAFWSEAKAVLAVRGGWGTTRVIDDLDVEPLRGAPRWLVGSSDLTALLMRLWEEIRLVSIHGPMPSRFAAVAPGDVGALFDLLLGSPWRCPEGLFPVRPGTARGPMIGGNLTVLAHLCGASGPAVTDGAILFLEEVNEAPYRVDRCLVQLERAGFLEGLEGVVLGAFTGCSPWPYGVSVEEVLEGRLGKLGIPVAGGYPGAHGSRNYPFVHGGEVRLRVANDVSMELIL